MRLIVANAPTYSSKTATKWVEVGPVEQLDDKHFALHYPKDSPTYLSARGDDTVTSMPAVGGNETFVRDGNVIIAFIGEGPRVFACLGWE